MGMHHSFRRRPRRGAVIVLNTKQKMGLLCLFFGIALLLLALGFNHNLAPVMTEMAINEANELIIAAVNEAIGERLLDGSLSYSRLVQLETDQGGNITALTTDMAQINILQATITNEVLQRVGELGETTMRIPIGNIVGGSFFSGRGPGIRFRVLTLGNPQASFHNEFTSAGINQTKHQIMLELTIKVNILVPGHQAQEVITTQMLVAETVIVGDVPHAFGQFSFPQ